VTPSAPSAVRERVALAAYTAGWRIVRLLPERLAYAGFDLGADLAWRLRGAGVRRLEANLARVRPDLDEPGLRSLSRAGLRSYLRYWCDSFRLPDWDEHRIVSTVRTEGDEPVRAALAEGRGVVMFLGHLGNWDHAGAWSALRLATVTTVAERLRPEQLFDRFVGFRERLGMRVIPLTGSNGSVFGALMRALRDGGFVPLLADRDLTAQGVEVRLFGESARVAGGPAGLALQTGAALHPVSIRYERLRGAGPRHGIVITWHAEVPVPELPQAPDGGRVPRSALVAAMTQSCVDALAGAIVQHPQDWHMLQPVFLADLAPGGATR
jgi:phosphatidylinositol dimannoside acyltransferase